MKSLRQLSATTTDRIPVTDLDSSGRIVPLEEAVEEYAFEKVIRQIELFKKKMLSEKLKRAAVQCCECSGKWHGRIVGEKKALWLHCDGPCERRFME